MTIYSLDELLSQFGTSLLFHVWFKLLLLDLPTDFAGGIQISYFGYFSKIEICIEVTIGLNVVIEIIQRGFLYILPSFPQRKHFAEPLWNVTIRILSSKTIHLGTQTLYQCVCERVRLIPYSWISCVGLASEHCSQIMSKSKR